MSSESIDAQVEAQRARISKRIEQTRSRLNELEGLLTAANTSENWARGFTIRSKLNELYSELTIYLYLLQEKRKSE